MKNENNSRINEIEDANYYASGNQVKDAAINGDDEFNEADITPEDMTLLEATDLDEDDQDLENAELDDSDDDGELLNEKSSATDLSGKDLDVPGSEDDDADEDIGEEDEENNSYSMADNE